MWHTETIYRWSLDEQIPDSVVSLVKQCIVRERVGTYFTVVDPGRNPVGDRTGISICNVAERAPHTLRLHKLSFIERNGLSQRENLDSLVRKWSD